MLSRLRDYLASVLGSEQPPAHSLHGRHLAAAALLMEVARADYAQDPREQLAMRHALHKAFALDMHQIDTLLALAREEAAESTSAHAFTRVINEEFSNADKSALMQALWSVALADGDLHRYEEHLIRRIAELIYVPHGEFIRTKIAAEQAFKAR
jgi:uncharacterized tellurite resistance protein B-like protein